MGAIVGLDIGRYSVKALRLSSTYRGFSAVAFDEEVLDTVVATAALGHVVDSGPDDWQAVETQQLRGRYSASRRKLKVDVVGREVPAEELALARSIWEHQMLGPERPIEALAYAFADEGAARAYLPELEHFGLEAWTFIGVEEVRIDAAAQTDTAEVSAEELEDAIHDAEDASLHAALASLSARGALAGDTVVVSMPPDLVMSSRMGFPFAEDAQLRAVTPVEFDESVPVELDELVVDYQVIGQSASEPGMHDVVVSGVKVSDLDIHLEIWGEGGVNPNFVVMGDASMLQLGAHLLKDAVAPFAIVDIGHRYTRVACIEPTLPQSDEAPRLGYSRTIQFGGHDITLALQEVLGSSYYEAEVYKHREGYVATDTIAMGLEGVKTSDAIKRALGRLLRDLRSTFYAHMSERRQGVEQIYLCGGTSRLTNLTHYISQELLPTEILPIGSNELGELDEMQGALPFVAAQSLALGLREAIPEALTSTVNFRRGSHAHQDARGWLRERLVGLVILLLLFGLALGGFLVSKYMSASWQHEATTASLERVTQGLFGQKMTDPGAIKKKLNGESDSAGVLPRHSAYDYYYEVSSRVGSNVELFEFDVDIFRQLIKLSGKTDSAATVDNVVDRLEEFDCFKGNVQKGDVESLGEGVRFSLSIAPECSDQKKKKAKKTKKTGNKE